MSKPRMRLRVAAGVVALGVAVGAALVGPSAQAQDAGAASCVPVLSLVLDAVDVGSSAGPPIVYSTGISVLGIAMPPADSPVAPLVGPAFSQFSTVFGTVTTAASDGGVELAQQLRTLIAPLAAGSAQGDAVLHQIAGVLDTFAPPLRPAIQPADRTLQQTASMLRIASCTP